MPVVSVAAKREGFTGIDETVTQVVNGTLTFSTDAQVGLSAEAFPRAGRYRVLRYTALSVPAGWGGTVPASVFVPPSGRVVTGVTLSDNSVIVTLR